jgi:hypothetical protein
LINDVHTCAACLADAVERVANGDLEYPVTINNSDIDLDAYAQFLDLSLLESYASRKLEHTTHPDDRVHCKCERFIGVKLAPSTIASATTIGQCLSCDGAACMTCTTQLDKDSKLSKALDHGCKEKLEALEKQRLSFVNGTDRGKGYQICPFCKRVGYLPDACHHIVHACGGEFRYLCGKPGKERSGHWGNHPGQCPQYPMEVQVPAAGAQAGGGLDERLRGLIERFEDIPVWGEFIDAVQPDGPRQIHIAQRANAPVLPPAARVALEELTVDVQERLQVLEAEVESLGLQQQPVEVEDAGEGPGEQAAAPQVPADAEDHEDSDGEDEPEPPQQVAATPNPEAYYYLNNRGQRVYAQRPPMPAHDARHDREDDFRNDG